MNLSTPQPTVRFHFTQASLKQEGCHVVTLSVKNDIMCRIFSDDISAVVRQVGAYYLIDSADLPAELMPAVVKITARLSGGLDENASACHYSGDGWHAELIPGGGRRGEAFTTVLFSVEGNDLELMRKVHHVFLMGQLMPSLQYRGVDLSSNAVADLIMNFGYVDLVHWKSVVQEAQDVVIGASRIVEALMLQIADLKQQLQDAGVPPR